VNATYLTYSEYTERGGTLDPADFMQQEYDARKRIDRWTDMRVQYMEAVPEDVKMCMMRLIALGAAAGAEAQMSNPTVTSFNNDGYSESFGNVLNAEEASAAMDDIIKTGLYGVLNDHGVPLLYRGVR